MSRIVERDCDKGIVWIAKNKNGQGINRGHLPVELKENQLIYFLKSIPFLQGRYNVDIITNDDIDISDYRWVNIKHPDYQVVP